MRPANIFLLLSALPDDRSAEPRTSIRWAMRKARFCGGFSLGRHGAATGLFTLVKQALHLEADARGRAHELVRRLLKNHHVLGRWGIADLVERDEKGSDVSGHAPAPFDHHAIDSIARTAVRARAQGSGDRRGKLAVW